VELVAGIDLGTSYFKIGLFDRDGKMRGLGRVAVDKDTDDTGRCELPVERFWQLLKTAFADACKQANALPEQVRALGYSSQVNSFVLLDKNNAPLTPLILWPDFRPKEVDNAVKKLWQHPDFLSVTGLGIGLTPTFCVAKLKWFEKHQPDIWARTQKIMTISDYFVFALTDKIVGDAGTASLLGLYDLPQHTWWNEAFKILGIDQLFFSTPLLPSSTAGTVTNKGAELLGFNTVIPLVVGSLDHHMAAIGAGVPSIAPTSESTGTVVACLNYTNDFAPKLGCCMGPGIDNKTFYQLACSSDGASVLEWYQKNFAADLSIPDLLSLAQNVPAGAEGLTALPSADTYTGLTGFKNASSKYTHGHYVRAIFESVARTLAGLVNQTACKSPSAVVATGGGAKSDLWLQIKADMLKTPFIRTDSQEPACRGAAMIAAAALGWAKSVEELAPAWIRIEKTFGPAA
jgi:xylulokinase